MHEILETIKPKKLYVCDTCGKKYTWREDAEKCEKTHLCHHEPEFILMESDNDAYEGIQVRCKKCNSEITTYKEFNFYSIEYNQEALKEIYAIMKKYNEK